MSGASEERRERVVGDYPLERLDDPAGGAVAFFGSADDVPWTIEQTVTIGGGWTLQGVFA
jgi:hypothetical protein